MVNPRIVHIPNGNSDLGKRAVDLAAEAGIELDEWQAYVLEASLRKDDSGKWAAKEVGLNVARQNGKNVVLLARELAELFIVKSQLTIHSAHEFATSIEHFIKLRELIEETPKLAKQVRSIRLRGGEEGIILSDKRRIRFRTRTKGGGRGFSSDLLIFDEAMFLPEMSIGALFPTKRARPDPQVWYTGSAVDQTVHEHGVVFSGVRQRGIGSSPKLAYFEWSVEGNNPSTVPPEVLSDKAAWAQANPALGDRISIETMEDEFEELKHMPRTFAVELLGVGDWPSPDYRATNPIVLSEWLELEDVGSKRGDQVSFGFDVSPERRGSISVVSQRPDGLWHMEIVEERAGTGWLPERLVELVRKHGAGEPVCDERGPAASLVPLIEELGVSVQKTNAGELGRACQRLVDAISEGTVRHIGQAELTGAIRAASTRPLGDVWAWNRKDSSSNIAPLVAVTLALSAAMTVRTTRFAVGVG